MLRHFRSCLKIPPPQQRFDVVRRLGIVVEHLAQLLDVRVEAVFEIDEGVFRPKMLADFLARDEFTGRSSRSGRTAIGRPCSLSFVPFLNSSPD